jgi:negative regulator of flagellin synthesis FlgM
MKITNGIDTTGSIERQGATDQAGAARSKPATSAPQGPGSSDTIRISDLSSQLAALENRFSTDGAFDAARVEEIKDAMREGHFKVNAEAVADKLLESVHELLRKPS